jgi:hypothetical protein
LLSLSLAVIGFASTGLLTANRIFQFSSAILMAIISSVSMFVHYRLHRLGNHFFTSYLNRKFPELQESADLMLFVEPELNSMQLIQRQNASRIFDRIFPRVRLPHRLFQSLMIFIGSITFYIVLTSLTPNITGESALPSKEIRPEKSRTAIFVKDLSIKIFPPAYTGLNSFESDDFDLTFPEASTVRWSVRFSGVPTDAKMFFFNNDSIILRRTQEEYSYHRNIDESGFYQLQWRDTSRNYHSDYYKMEVVKDQPARISIEGLDQFTKLSSSSQHIIHIKCKLTDDYGLNDALLIATVSKGSGEGIKFREEKLRFDSPKKVTGKSVEMTRALDLKKLGLEPGDELYFYAEASDNKTPIPNRNRTETFFIAIQDTAREITSVDSGMGVDLMPEYFRSQRQIIIDTEKLLRDKKRIPVTQFNFTSNELGYDQKILRLRYGQFLGGEDGAGIGQHAEETQEDESDPLKKFSHQHDSKNEHNLVDEKKQSHGRGDKTDDEQKDPLKDFVHQHDNTEQATFFIQSLKTKLKIALAQMWDAELYLRMYQPEKSLPYQYKALNLLKEISSDSRIFVHRSGFDPPPIKEDRRLTADLSGIKTPRDFRHEKQAQTFPAIRDAIGVIEKMLSDDSRKVSTEEQKHLQHAGRELSALAVEQPVVFFKGLSLLKLLDENPSTCDDASLLELRRILVEALPTKTESPIRQQFVGHSLNRSFLKNLETSTHD